MLKLAVLLFGVLFTGLLPAQFGIRGGVALGTTYGPSERSGDHKLETFRPAVGYQFGIAGRVASLGEKLAVNAELAYEARRSATRIEDSFSVGPDAGGTLNGKVSDRYDYLTLPVLLTLEGKLFNLYAGPSFSYLIRARRRTDLSSETITIAGSTITSVNEEVDLVHDERYTNSAINRLCLSLNAGASMSLTKSLSLDLRLYHTLTDISDNREDYSIFKVLGYRRNYPPREDADRTVGLQASLLFRL